MRKILYTLLAIVGLVACAEQEMPNVQSGENGQAELTFSVQIPEHEALSRSLNSPVINSLTLVVFNGEGYLSQVAEATPVGAFTVSTTAETQFKVTLTATSEKRIIHFIANYNVGDLEYGPESQLIGAMETSGGQDAYWQRVEFPNGITDTDETINLMKPVRLVRNYAKISVKDNAENFTLTSYTLMNVPQRGTVAAYNTNGGGFVNYLNGTVLNTYANIADVQGYQGFMPRNLNLNTAVPTADDFTTNALYMYEHTYANDQPTYVLIKGSYASGTDTYYKLAIVKKDANFVATHYDILRNFEYALSIDKVTSAGYATPAEAAANPSANNLSASVELSSLLNVSNGIARLMVSFTDTTLVNNNAIQLKYKYIPDIDTETTDNGSVTFYNRDGGQVISSYEDGTADDADGYRSLTITPYSPEMLEKTQSITLAAGGLTREVRLTLVQPKEMTVSATPFVLNSIGQEVSVWIDIPDGLSETLFPLMFYVESAKLSLFPDTEKGEYMPVVVGPTLVDGATYSSFSYDKEITWEEYQSLPLDVAANTRKITCLFKTNISDSASDIYVYNKYFGKAKTDFANYAPTVTDLNLTDASIGVDQPATLTFHIASTNSVRLEFTNLAHEGKTEPLIYTPTVVGEQTIELTTTTFAEAGTVKVTEIQAGGEFLIGEVSHQRTLSVTLNMDVSGTEYNRYPENNSTVAIYNGNDTQIGTCTYTRSGIYNPTRRLSNFTFTDTTGLTGDTILTLQYRRNNVTYTATVTLGGLVDGTVETVVFSAQ